jgi:hypothetical protein
MSIDLEVADRGLLIKALEALQARPQTLSEGTVSFRLPSGEAGFIRPDGRLVLQTRQAAEVSRQLKTAYAAQCVAAAAAKFGWQTTQKRPQQVVLTRRA